MQNKEIIRVPLRIGGVSDTAEELWTRQKLYGAAGIGHEHQLLMQGDGEEPPNHRGLL